MSAKASQNVNSSELDALLGRKAGKKFPPNIKKDSFRVSLWVILLVICSTLLVAVLLMEIGGINVEQLQDSRITLSIALGYTIIVYLIRMSDRSIRFYSFMSQATFAFAFGLFHHHPSGESFTRTVILGTFLVLLFNNLCVDRLLLWMEKINDGAYRVRFWFCTFWVVAGVTAHIYIPKSEVEVQTSANSEADSSANNEKSAIFLLLPEVDKFGNWVKKEMTDLFLPPSAISLGYEQAWLNKLREFENGPLYAGQVEVSKQRVDDISKKKVIEVGYGVTNDEIDDGIREGVLPKGTTLPSKMTKKEADDWFYNITVVIYDKVVRRYVKKGTVLNNKQRFALLAFAHNLGGGALQVLVSDVKDEERLNSGNYDTVPDLIKLYNTSDGVVREGLKKRRKFEADLFLEGIREQQSEGLPFPLDGESSSDLATSN